MNINSNLTDYDLLKSMVEAGAIVYKTTDTVALGEIYLIDIPPSPIMAAQSYKTLYVMSAEMEPSFLKECRNRDISAIPMKTIEDALLKSIIDNGMWFKNGKEMK